MREEWNPDYLCNLYVILPLYMTHKAKKNDWTQVASPQWHLPHEHNEATHWEMPGSSFSSQEHKTNPIKTFLWIFAASLAPRCRHHCKMNAMFHCTHSWPQEPWFTYLLSISSPLMDHTQVPGKTSRSNTQSFSLNSVCSSSLIISWTNWRSFWQ